LSAEIINHCCILVKQCYLDFNILFGCLHLISKDTKIFLNIQEWKFFEIFLKEITYDSLLLLFARNLYLNLDYSFITNYLLIGINEIDFDLILLRLIYYYIYLFFRWIKTFQLFKVLVLNCLFLKFDLYFFIIMF